MPSHFKSKRKTTLETPIFVLTHELFKIPNFILSTLICRYLTMYELINFATTSKLVLALIDKSPEWEKESRKHFCIPNEEDINWREFYIKNRIKYFHLLKIHNAKILNNLANYTPFNIVLGGLDGSGKSNLAVRLVSERFNETYDPEIEDVYRKRIHIRDKQVILDVFDTAGIYNFSRLDYQLTYFKKGDIYFIVYDISSEESFREAQRLYKFVVEIKGEDDFGLFIVATKIDLPASVRVISREKGEKLACACKAIYFEVSAKQDIGVMELFEEAAWMMARKDKNLSAKERRMREKSFRKNKQKPTCLLV